MTKVTPRCIRPFTPWRPEPAATSKKWSKRVCRRSALSCRFIGSAARTDPCPPRTRTQPPDFLEDLLLIFGPEPPVLLVEARARLPATQETARTDVQVRPGSACSLWEPSPRPKEIHATHHRHVATSPPMPEASGDARSQIHRLSQLQENPRRDRGRFDPEGAGEVRRTWRHARRPSSSVRIRPFHPYLEDEDGHPVAVP